MKATEVIRFALDSSYYRALGLASDIKDAPLTQPTPNGGNHPLWIIGHLAYSEANLLNRYILGRSNPLAEWKDTFGMGSTPTTNAADYPPMDELIAKWEEVRAATLNHLETLSDTDLDKPSHAPEASEQYFGTVGKCLVAMVNHASFHTGQIADARRAAGRDILVA